MLLFAAVFFASSYYARCGPAVSPITTAAIVQVESAGNPLAINDNTTRRSYAPKAKKEAVALASKLVSQGHSLDFGLMQVNSIHLKRMNLSLSAVFDPCTNIKTGTTVLASFYRQYDTILDKNQVLFRALSAYNTGSAWGSPRYVNKILEVVNAPYRVRLYRHEEFPPHRDKKLKEIQPKKSSPASLFFDEASIFFSPTFLP